MSGKGSDHGIEEGMAATHWAFEVDQDKPVVDVVEKVS